MKARELHIAPVDVKLVRDFIEQRHYSKSINGVKISQCFGVYFNDDIVGAVLFGQLSTTAWKRFGETEREVLELRRLVLMDEAERNSESRVIGWCLRWIKKNLPEVRIIVSYADPMYGHSGVIYRASNFKHDGMTPPDKGFKDKNTGKVYHSRALRTRYKGEYKPFVKKLRKKLDEGLLEEIVLTGKHRFIYVI
tara:strand:- start:2855 stop:3436 length:582 start_codon:yes stop_codon:yes gene_type:complete